jgi:hypothetical protein
MKTNITFLLCAVLLVVGYGCIGNNPPNSPPVADAGPDQTVSDADRNGSEDVKLDGSGSKDENGAIIGWTWSDDLGGTIPDDPNPSATLDVGTHIIALTVIDNKGAVGTDTVKITVDYLVLHTADSVNAGPMGSASAVDGKPDTFWEVGSSFPHWIQTDFGIQPKTIRGYTLQTGPSSHGINGIDAIGRMPKDWRFEGSNDGEDWTILDTRTNQTDWEPSEIRAYSCADPDSFQYYRLYIAAGVNPNMLRLYEATLVTQTDPNFAAPEADKPPDGVGAVTPAPGTHQPAEDSAGPNEPESFTLIVLPDTQSYTLNYPQIFTSQTQWIKDNKKAMNIVFVLHEGDFTGNNTDLEWQRASTSMSILDGVVPYTFCAGNHDVPNHGRPPADPRDNAKLNEHFPVGRFEAEPWWGGCDPNNPDARYVFFDAAGMEFMIVSLEFGPNDAMLRWANRVVCEFSNKRVIFLTHCYVYEDDTRVGPGDQWGCRGWAGDGNDGEQMWEKFVKLHKNIFLVLSGHTLGDGLGRLTSTGVNGNPVHQILANYQDPPIPSGNGGNGWLRIMKFVPRENKIEVRTYSPWLDKFAADEQNRFDLVYPMTTKRLSSENGYGSGLSTGLC